MPYGPKPLRTGLRINLFGVFKPSKTLLDWWLFALISLLETRGGHTSKRTFYFQRWAVFFEIQQLQVVGFWGQAKQIPSSSSSLECSFTQGVLGWFVGGLHPFSGGI